MKTRKAKWSLDYEKLAQTLALTKPLPIFQGSLGSSALLQWKADVLGVADVLQAARPNFDRQRFLEATGFLPRTIPVQATLVGVN